MRLTPSREQLAFAASVTAVLADAEPPAVARAWAAGDPAPGRRLWQRLAGIGVLSLWLPDDPQTATPLDVVLTFEQLGRAAVPGPYVESVAVLPMLLAATGQHNRLQSLGSGELIATIAAPPHTPYALDAMTADVSYLLAHDTLHSAPIGAARSSVDPTRLLSEVGPGPALGRVDAAAALRRGTLATAAQLYGAGTALLDRSTAFARQRTQFGRPIGAFQAVKHRLADVAVGLEFARALLLGAAHGNAHSDRDVSAAKVACADAAYQAARAALQVHGAIGYTAELDLALWLTKVRALYGAWGDQRHHRTAILHALRQEPARQKESA